MNQLRFTLVADGSSDASLVAIIEWLLIQANVNLPIQGQWADFRWRHAAPKRLPDRISLALRLYPCDILFVHRDAEREPLRNRIFEIKQAIDSLETVLPAVCVIPVRMQEAWLLFDEQAIRTAAGNKNGTSDLSLPRLNKMESIPNPKHLLYEALRIACGHSGRRLKDFPCPKRAARVSTHIEDFSPLRQLSAFAALETEVRNKALDNGWTSPQKL